MSWKESSVLAPALKVRLDGDCVMTGGLVGGPGIKLAVMILLESRVSTSGFKLPDASPLQPLKRWLATGAAVNATVSPFVKTFLRGVTATDPLPSGNTVSET